MRFSRPAVIELVGPAGVGKTTLSLQLEANGQARRGTIWFVPTPALARGTLRQFPTALTLYRETRRFLWDEIKHLARLDALLTFLRTSPWNGARLVALDEGPVYTLSWLQVIGHRRFREGAQAAFLQRTLQQWAPHLDAVVVLDAPDDVIMARIRRRQKPHLVKDRSAPEVTAFIEEYRRAAERVIVDLQALGGPPVVRLDCTETDGLADRVLNALGRQQRARTAYAH